MQNKRKQKNVGTVRKKCTSKPIKKQEGKVNIGIIEVLFVIIVIITITCVSIAINERKREIENNKPKAPWQTGEKGSLSKTIKYLSKNYAKPGTYKAMAEKPQWGEDGTASVKLHVVGDLPEGANPQYSIQGTNEWKAYDSTKENIITGVRHKDAIAVKIYNAKNKVTHTSYIYVKDKIKPQTASISLSTTQTYENTEVTATVTHTDNESGINIEKCKWVYNTISTPIGTNETEYTGGSFSGNPQTISLTANAEGTYYLHVLSVDNAGHKVETISAGVTVELAWDLTKVYEATSDDGVKVPVPIGFVPSTISGEKRVDEGFVIKQGNNGALTEGINEFVWVPVPKPEEMFTVDNEGNPAGQLYDFSGTSSSKRAYSTTGYREPDVVTVYDNDSSNYTNAKIKDKNGNEITTASQFKEQLQEEFNKMKESVERYKGFYIGRYETGNLSQSKAVVQKNNNDIGSQNWYTQYQKSKGIVEGTSAKSTMIWGCQWDACMRWMQNSSNDEVRNFVTNSTGKGNYSGTQEGGNKAIPTGSNESYKVNNIYDMAGNVEDWTIEADFAGIRVNRRRLL